MMAFCFINTENIGRHPARWEAILIIVALAARPYLAER
jgi:hypothetical protein